MSMKESITNLNNFSFSIADIQEHKCSPDWKIEKSLHKTHSILFVTKGSGRICLDREEYVLAENSCIWLEPNMGIEAEADSYNPLQYFEINYTYETLDSTKQTCEFPFSGNVRVQNSVQVIKLIKEIYKRAHEQEDLEQFRKNALFYQLIYCFYESYYNSNDHTKSPVDITKDYMKKYYEQEISRDTLAKLVGISTDYYSHLFKKEVGVSPIEYLTKIRIERAKEILSSSNNKLKSIAKSVGYSDEFYFSRLFKRMVGTSPTVYAKNNRKKIFTYSYAFCSNMLALGVLPYATIGYIGTSSKPHLKRQLTNSLIFDEATEVEEMVGSQPDLIIYEQMNNNRNKQINSLEKIAPTIPIPWMEMDWREHFQLIARIIEKEKEAERWLIEYQQKAEKASDKVKKVVREESVLILRIHNGEYCIYGDRNIGAVLYHDLKLAAPFDLHTINHCKKITISELPIYDADHILLMVDHDEGCKRKLNSLLNSEQWESLKAVQKNNVNFIDRSLWLEYSAFAHENIMDEAVRLFSS